MKSFGRYLTEKKNKESHYVNKNGTVVLLHAIGEKHPTKGRIKGKKKKLKENDESWKDNHYSDADENVSELGAMMGRTGLNEDEFNEATALSERLGKNHADITEDHAKEVRRYTKGSSMLNKSLIKAHRDGHERFAEWESQGGAGAEAAKSMRKTHEALMANMKPTGQSVHLFSGVGHDFGEIAKQSKDGIIHSPAFISATHNIDVAKVFAHDNMPDGRDGNLAHMVKIHVKPHQKILHASDHSDYPAEHESIVPAGTKLKYSHTSEHHYRHNPDGSTPQKRRMKIHHFEIHDPWIK